jgi:hypothetical protein
MSDLQGVISVIFVALGFFFAGRGYERELGRKK